MSTTIASGHQNPFLTPYALPFGAVPFDQIQDSDYRDALDKGLAEQKANIQKIIDNPEAPTFENTVVALEYSDDILSRVCGILFNLTEAATNDTLDALVEEYSPILSKASNEIFQNEALFQRVKAVHDADRGSLSPEDNKLLDDCYIGFVRSGANLPQEKKDQLKEISSKLSVETFQFGQNVLKETNAFSLHITHKEDVAGLPASALELAAHKAQEKGLDGWVFDLSMPSYGPFLKYADSRELRYQMWLSYNSKANNNNENDNKELVRSIVNNRLAMAQIMGEKDYGSYKLERTMAQNNEGVYQLLNQLLEHYKPVALQEVETIRAYAAKQLGIPDFQLEPWDFAYYSEKYKEEKFHFNSEQLKPYFELSAVKKGVFGLATQLYGIQFVPNKTLPVYHKDVNVYEVYDADSTFLGLLYTDFFPRDNKRGGAWMTEFKGQYIKDGVNSRPLISIVMNFTPPTPNNPSLLTFGEVTTFLHEFGHSLHGLLTNVTYPSLSGTNVYHDFVELPSQFMENFALDSTWLAQTAHHYQTGEVIPQELVQKMKDASNYQAAYACVRQLNFGFLDMAWHTQTAPYTGDIEEFENQATLPTQLFKPYHGTCVTTQFNHLFAGGYAAGYYGYKWSEVLDADAYAVFKAHGGIDRATATRFRNCILSKGGTEHPMKLYQDFKGSAPTIDALLERDGIQP